MNQHQFSCQLFCNTKNNVTVANYARLLCLTVEQGTECMKNFVLNNLPVSQPMELTNVGDSGQRREDNLINALADKMDHFDKLRNRNKINKATYETLYPPYGQPVDFQKFDMSLWYILARNVALNERKVNYIKFEKQPPSPRDNLPQHHVIRIRNMRNIIFHLDSPQLETSKFDNMWREISTALLALGTSQNIIDDYALRDLDPTATSNHHMQLREQVHIELESLYKAEIHKRKQFLIGLIIVAFVLIGVSMVSSYVLYVFTGTWTSCIHSMTTVLNDNGAISIMPRKGWGAKSSKSYIPKLNTPVEYVIISHTAMSGTCSTTDDCCNIALITQEISFHKGWYDVAYNYMVGNDGVIYEGRGNELQSSSAAGWNNRSISIGFLGKFVLYPPTDDALDVTPVFLQQLVDEGVLTHNFTIYGLCQVRPFPDAPGAALYNRIIKWKGEGPTNTWRWRNLTDSYHCNTDPML